MFNVKPLEEYWLSLGTMETRHASSDFAPLKRVSKSFNIRGREKKDAES